MIKKLLLIVLGLFLLVSLAFILFKPRDSKNPSLIQTPTGQSIVEITDRYVASLVGESEFNKNYKFDDENSEKCQDNDQPGGCYIRYKFIPAEKFGGSEYLFFYTFDDNEVVIANNNIPITLPSCERDKNRCDFKLSLNSLKDIAKRENLSDEYFRLVMYNGKIVAEISYCNLETMDNRRKIFVDLQTGSVVWDGPNGECQGII